MKTLIIRIIAIAFVFAFTPTIIFAKSFGSKICKENGYTCYVVKKGDTWAKLFPDKEEREIVKRINRMNVPLYRGLTIALPASGVQGHMEYAPFPAQIDPLGEKAVIIDMSDLAFGAYGPDGTLENWGPISGGKQYCADVGRGCRTPTGKYAIYSKQGAGCKSTKFPVGRGGAPMPYCMFFKGGFAMHGSPTVPGYNDSHGCVRLFTDDAQWLNQEFSSGSYVKVIIRQ